MNTSINNGVKVSVSAAFALIFTTVVAVAVAVSSTGLRYAATGDQAIARVLPMAASLMNGTV